MSFGKNLLLGTALLSLCGVDRVKVRVGDDGRFSLVELVAPDTVETVFCFKASSDGWQSVVGELVLSRLAAPGSTIELVLEPGV